MKYIAIFVFLVFYIFLLSCNGIKQNLAFIEDNKLKEMQIPVYPQMERPLIFKDGLVQHKVLERNGKLEISLALPINRTLAIPVKNLLLEQKRIPETSSKTVEPDNSVQEEPIRKTEPFSLLSFIFSIFGFFLLFLSSSIGLATALLFILLALGFGIAGIVNISQDPKRLSGMGFGIAGIVIGLLDLIILFIILLIDIVLFGVIATWFGHLI